MEKKLKVCKNCKHWGIFHWSLQECPGNCNSYKRQVDLKWNPGTKTYRDDLLMSELQTAEDFSCQYWEDFDPPRPHVNMTELKNGLTIS